MIRSQASLAIFSSCLMGGLLLVFSGCGAEPEGPEVSQDGPASADAPADPETPSGVGSRPNPGSLAPPAREFPKEHRVKFTDQEQVTLQELGMAIYRGKIILNAQPPITEAQLAAVYDRVTGEIPPDLVALWKISFGGELDYDYELVFGEHLYEASLRELFYPGSDHYHDLHGWIDHELEVAQTIAEEEGAPIPNRTPYLPFGGFEYLERVYVSVEKDEYGDVLYYAQGIPWKGRMNEDSIATVASSVAELFDQLSLHQDPFDEQADEYANGKEIVERIKEIEGENPELAKKLKALVQQSVVDWRGIVSKTDFTQPLSAGQSRALRLALRHAATAGDVSLVEQLHAAGAPFDGVVQGTHSVLVVAMGNEAFPVVEKLLELQVDVGEAPIIHAANCPDSLMLKLVEAGAAFDPEGLYTAAETGALKGALALANSPHLAAPLSPQQLAAGARERAAENKEEAEQVERGELSSYLTPQQYRQQAAALEEFANRLLSGANAGEQ